jgi:hypothetical protein
MKKLLLLLLIAAANCNFVSAQENRNLMVYADGAASFSNNSGQYFLSAGAGYKIDKNWTLGGTFSIADLSGASPSLVRSFGIGAFARYTQNFGNENRFFWYIQGNAGYLSSLNENSGPGYNNRDTWTGFSAVIAPGVGINLPHGFALTFTPASISYRLGSRNSFGHQEVSGVLEAGLGRSMFGAAPAIGIMKNIRTGHRKQKAAGEKVPQNGE